MKGGLRTFAAQIMNGSNAQEVGFAKSLVIASILYMFGSMVRVILAAIHRQWARSSCALPRSC
jgi:hypothetical protein